MNRIFIEQCFDFHIKYTKLEKIVINLNDSQHQIQITTLIEKNVHLIPNLITPLMRNVRLEKRTEKANFPRFKIFETLNEFNYGRS